MPVLSTTGIRDVIFRSIQAKQIYLGTKLVWEADQGPDAFYSGTGWYKATDTGIVFCKGIPSRQTYSFTGDSRVYVSVHTIEDAKLYAERAATSNMVDLANLFHMVGPSFNPDIGHWDVSNVTSMSNMFMFASGFNRDISNWNVSKVTNMSYMFYGAIAFKQNLTKWCVTNIKAEPSVFYKNSGLTAANLPKWGTCPPR